jgi:S1-C subfamily serine protease
MLGFESCDGRTHLKVWSRTNWGLGAVAVSAILAIFALGFAFGVHKHASQQVPPSDSPQVIARLNDLDAAVRKLSLGQLQPSDVIAATRDSVCFIVSTYSLTAVRAGHLARDPHHLLGSGFLIAGNLVVSNRHVLEPWFGDPDSEDAIRAGSTPRRERITAYFPGYPDGVDLTNVVVSSDADVAIASVKFPEDMKIQPLSLASRASSPGDPVVVIGYPLGVTTMVAKSTAFPFRELTLRQTQGNVDHIAKVKLIRPSATQGHVVDVSDQTLMYDASTAHGSSGGPVFNLHGEVIGVNAAFIDGFTGSSLGVSTGLLEELLANK